MVETGAIAAGVLQSTINYSQTLQIRLSQLAGGDSETSVHAESRLPRAIHPAGHPKC